MQNDEQENKPDADAMERIPAKDARDRLPELMARAGYKGERFVLTRNGAPLAVIIGAEQFNELISAPVAAAR